MITKLAKAKDNWFFKIISAAVAVSFISLFGVTGYINSASQNQAVVKVGKKSVTQSEFQYLLQKEINALRNLMPVDADLTDEMRTSLTEDVLKQLINDSVLEQSMVKYDIHFPKSFVQYVIYGQSEFKNPLNGQFHPELFKRYLSAANMTEQEYVAEIERSLARKIMVGDLIQNFNIPQVLLQATHRMDNKRKSFKYVVISPEDVKIDRKITDDEIKQYFEDFNETFMLPEQRDALVLFVPNEVVIQKYVANDALAEDYFKQHQNELNVPEKREIKQMIFLDKETAEKALSAVNDGHDFAETAKNLKADNADEPSLGIVSQDELADELADATFKMNVGENKLLPVADTWQVVSVKQILPAKKAVFEEQKEKILQLLAEENLYDALRQARADIDDAVNAGRTLEDIAEMLGGKTFKVTGIREEAPVNDVPLYAKNLVSSLDFNELVFSYGLDEITSAEEFDDGIAVIQVTNISDAHMPEIDDVRQQIIDLWTVQEKNALAKETADNIVADIEDGSDISVAAKARDLEIFRSEPISRSETFANLSKADVSDLFVANDKSVHIFEQPNNTYVVATPLTSVAYDDALTEEGKKALEERLQSSLFTDMMQAALDSYARDFKIKVDYKKAGFIE